MAQKAYWPVTFMCKTHTEQVMDANFSVVLNEMSNGKAYYVCDNGRIRPKPQENCDIRSNIAYGGDRPKTFTHNRDYGHITKDNSHLRYNYLDNVRYNRQSITVIILDKKQHT